MKDRVGALRTKVRMIAELRYPAVPQFLDMRGDMLGRIYPRLMGRFPTWQADANEVFCRDKFPEASREFGIGYRRSIIIFEDPDSLQAFVDLADYLVHIIDERLGPHLEEVERIGIRFIEVIGTEQFTYEQVASDVMDRFHKNPLNLDLELVDSHAIIDHKYGRYEIGPTKPEDRWILNLFRDKTLKAPAGLAVDIDSFAEKVALRRRGELAVHVNNVLQMTLAVEEALLSAAGALS